MIQNEVEHPAPILLNNTKILSFPDSSEQSAKWNSTSPPLKKKKNNPTCKPSETGRRVGVLTRNESHLET